LQRAAEAALQEGLAQFELRTGRARFESPEANLADTIRQIEAGKAADKPSGPAWQQALSEARLPLYDVHWTPAVLVEKRESKDRTLALKVGLKDGRTLPLTVSIAGAARRLQLYDVIYVVVTEAKGKSAASAALRTRPEVQGAAVVLDNKTGKVLAMAGGFSYPLSQFNRASQAYRQPGSALKPLTYLAALSSGLQPNTLVWDTPVTLPPVGASSGGYIRERDYWTPKNYDSTSSGPITLRMALENSKNLVTARLLNAIDVEPEESLKRVCTLALEAQLYKDCVNHYPFVLGAQPLRVLDIAALYGAIANEGALPRPYLIESIERGGRRVYEHPSSSLAWIGSADRSSFYQLKTILQGVLERGTARSIRQLAPYVGGKTGTSDGENDAWFVGFTNEVSVAVWVGYDNAGIQRRTLGAGQTGATIAIPIFEPIISAVWSRYAPKTAIKPASPEAQRHLAAVAVDLRSGTPVRVSSGQTILEHLRTDRWGEVANTQYRLVPEDEALAYNYEDSWSDGDTAVRPGSGFSAWGYGQSPWWRPMPVEPQPYWRRASPWEYEQRRQQQRRVDPDYSWGYRRLY
jgi:membrane carboxypeptidase/penicillin-binding protein